VNGGPSRPPPTGSTIRRRWMVFSITPRRCSTAPCLAVPGWDHVG
jgi:hypothetical protein